MTTWTADAVAERFQEAAETIRRLPRQRIQGYYSLWPEIVRQESERFAAEDATFRFPPDPAAIDRMAETIHWPICLTPEERKLVWMRAEEKPWKDVCRILGCDRTTAWRRWRKALARVALHLTTATLGNSTRQIARDCG
jgi:hypothetical protein